MEECRCSATGSLIILTQERDEQRVLHPRCFTQGETVPVPIPLGAGWAFYKTEKVLPMPRIETHFLGWRSQVSVTKM